MRIIFGIRHFKIKSYSLKDLGLADENVDDITIERRQQYFHLYFIPFFATGKKWAIRKEGKLYDLPPKYEAILAERDYKHRTPLYAFALPLLVVLGLLIYLIAEEADSYASKKRAQERFKLELVDLNQKIEQTNSHDFYKFHGIKNYSGDLYLKVKTVIADSVLFQLPETKPKWYSGSGGELAAYFSDTPDSAKLAWITRSNLKNYIKNDYADNAFPGQKLPFIGDTEMYRLEKVYHFQGPELLDRGEGNMADNTLSISFINKGLATYIIDVENLESNVDWNVELPLLIQANEKFTIDGHYDNLPQYTTEITCEDSDGTQYKYLLKGSGINRKIEKI